MLYVPTEVIQGIRVPVITEEIQMRLANAEGPIPYPLTNDRAFRGILSYSEDVRRHFAAILLDQKVDEILSVEIKNPVNFGQALSGKTTEEDVNLLVNKRTVLNIEMQNVNLQSNSKRFLTYLCRNFDTLKAGEDYNDLKQSLLVGIMNYTLDEAYPEFYAQYRILNKKTGRPLFKEDQFFGFNILDLNSSHLADEQDRKSGRILLARLCKASTWEELKELGKESPFAKEVTAIMYMANADERERLEMEAARRYEETKLTMEHDLEREKKRADDAEKKLADLEGQNSNLKDKNTNLEEQISSLKEQLKKLQAADV